MKRHPQELRILVADDHPLFRRGVRGLLHDQPGWRVVGEAVSGREAVDQAKKLRPDVAILVLTMHESKQMLRRVLEAGASGYVLKSDFPHSLVEAVKNNISGQAFF